jgi:hypothetical protein
MWEDFWDGGWGWECGDVGMCECGNVGMWECGDVGMWRCGDVVSFINKGVFLTFKKWRV